MIKSNENKIEVYSKIEKKEMESAIKLAIITTILTLIFFAIDVNIITIFSLCFSSIILLIAIIIYKGISEEPKLQVILTREYVEIYQKKGTFKYDMDKIISFSSDNSSASLNEVFIKYYNEKNKKVTKTFILKGMENRKFTNIANELLNNKDSITYVEILDEKENENGLKEENTWANVVKILCYVGKEKLVTILNNKKNVDKMDNLLYFIDKNGKQFKIYWEDIVLEKDLNLKINNFYAVKYDEKKELYNIIYTDFKFDTRIVEEYKNKMDIKTTLIFDDEIINKEISVLDKYRKTKNVCIYILVLILFVMSILIFVKNEWYIPVVFKVFPMFIFAFLVVFAIITMNVISKIKKIEN